MSLWSIWSHHGGDTNSGATLFRLMIDGSRSTIVLVLIAIIVFATTGVAVAETADNQNSAIGVNLQPIAYFSSELPFLNIMKSSDSWITHSSSTWDTNEEASLNLDSDGWPKTLTKVAAGAQQFNSVGVLLLRSLPQTSNGYYPGGKYVVLYQGEGSLTYGFDASLVSSSPGRDVINVATPSSAGIDLRITSTDPKHTGNYIRNVQVVKAENEAAIGSGQLFNPAFLATLKKFRALRYMDWLATNNSPLTTWASRPLPSNAFWGTNRGVPLEIAIQLANTVGADAWLNIPAMADDDYVSQMANLVKAQLGTGQKAYVELSNEVWNGIFSQNAYAISKGQPLFPKAENKWYAGWEWYGMRVAQIGDIWYGAYGGSFASRVTVVMAGQAANTAVLQEELSTPDWTQGPAVNHHVGAAAVAPYFLGTPSDAVVNSLLASADGLSALFAQLNTTSSELAIAQRVLWMTSHAKLLAPYKLPMLAYEGGQSLQGVPTYGPNSAALNLFFAANRDPRMSSAYITYLSDWKSSGGTLFMHYADSFPMSQFGMWGLLESTMQTIAPLSAAPAKWQAVQNFITNNPCWWNGCSGGPSNGGSLGEVPLPPSNLSVR